MLTTDNERERQRVAHLVLGLPRPRAIPGAAPAKSARRRKPSKPTPGPRPIALLPGIEEQVALRERWSHKQGTPETCEHNKAAKDRPGSLARLFASAVIDKDQLAAAEQIAEAYHTITADVRVRTSSVEMRVDGGGHGRAEELALGRVYAELTYSWWRCAVGERADMLLRVIVHDVGLTIVAREHGLSMPRARRIVTEGLDLWWTGRQRTMRQAATIVG